MDPRPEQSLVGVDVAHARDPALVKDERLNRRRPTPGLAPQVIGRELGRERLDAEPSFKVGIASLRAREEVTGPEASWVDVQELMLAVERESDPHVGGLHRRVKQEGARHSEMDQEVVLV
jgi:hypothetical protein